MVRIWTACSSCELPLAVGQQSHTQLGGTEFSLPLGELGSGCFSRTSNSSQLISWYQFLRPELRTQSNCLCASELGNFELVNEGRFQLWSLGWMVCSATEKSASKVWRWPHQCVLISFLLVSIPLLSGVEILARGDKSLFQACHYWSSSLSIFHGDGDTAWDIGVSVNLSCTCLSESLVFLFHCCILNKPVYRTQFPLLSKAPSLYSCSSCLGTDNFSRSRRLPGWSLEHLGLEKF